ncbi:P-type conjugative transfer protein TrbJ [Zophobihabitans entericus]|uniref:P-type conjugative transfer protein TrbJ n=1 Tax=Zophobihabitans entericus TaxID=1635327 RepID=A0A6G9IE49_9GAMM|nr:P-type conjugative transfer protein TrbJ [Zophobihabitans entericus]QIQ22516.1 P-type conjugative transfer protein TrbJ [Zophobihabitans entericus]
MKNKITKLVLASFLALNMNVSLAGIPVADGLNLGQNIMNVMEAINQTLKQIEEYETQLQQYENQLKNSVGPAVQIWDKANETMNNLNAAMSKLEQYKRQIGDIDSYLNKFQDVKYYQTAPCLSTGKCTAEDIERLNEASAFSAGAVKVSNDAALSTINLQQKSLMADAKQLERLQGAVQGADGQMAALQYSNQLAGNQANQLLQMRALLVAQHNAVITKQAADNDKTAQEAAAIKSVRSGAFVKSTNKSGMLH